MLSEVHVLGLGERHPPAEVVPPPPDVAAVLAQVPDALGELGQVAVLEQGVAGVGRERAEQVGTQHRRDHRAVAAAGLAADRPVPRRVQRPVVPVDPRDDLVADVGVVAAGAGRVEVLAAAVRGPRVHEDNDRGRGLAGGEHGVGRLGERLPVGRPVAPDPHVPGEAGDHVDAGVAALRLVVVARRDVHEQGPLVRVVQRVAAQQLAADDVLFQAAGELGGPRQHAHSLDAGR